MRTIFWCCALSTLACLAAGQCCSYQCDLAAHALCVVGGLSGSIATAVAYGRLMMK